MKDNTCYNQLSMLLSDILIPTGYKLTHDVELDLWPENSKYCAFNFGLNNKRIIYRKAKLTLERPGAFLTLWQRPSLHSSTDNKPIPLKSTDLDYLFIRVQDSTADRDGLFIFPVTTLVEQGVVSSDKNKGKTAFRVFPPWSEDRGLTGTKVFSVSGKKAQAWQLPYYVEIKKKGHNDNLLLEKIFTIE